MAETLRSGGWSAALLRLAATGALCAACWWLWTGDLMLWRVGLGSLDLVIRILLMFLLVSVAEAVHARLRPPEEH